MATGSQPASDVPSRVASCVFGARDHIALLNYKSKEVMIRCRSLGPAALPADVTLSVLATVHTALAWLLSQHAFLDDTLPLLLKLWVHPSSFDGQEVEGGEERGTLFCCGPLGHKGRSTQGVAPSFQ